ncbi:MAG: precorrin-3B C(17)-methyltransferase, partial [Terrimicrobiaceae bacterium]
MNALGKLHLVSVGPGFAELIPPMAQSALRASDAIVSYELYLTWIAPWIEGKEIHSFPLTRERERAAKAIELARAGRVASLVSSGDIGVYAMASLVLEEMRKEDHFELKIIPGISAVNSCASLLGSPLSHDFATLSLSDLLCPWEWIE